MMQGFLFLLGPLCLGYGLYRLYGPVSVTYIGYGVRLHEANYVCLPMSVFGFALFFATIAPESWSLTILLVGLFIGLGGSFLTIFIKIEPEWLKWLKREHGDVWHILQLEIKEEGQGNWDKRINTPEELRIWVKQVRKKHNL